MKDTDVLAILDVPFRFSERPSPVLPRHRMAWGMALVALMLSLCSRGQKASLQKLHVLNWAVRNEQNRSSFLAFLAASASPGAVLVRYEPSLNRAIDFAAGEGLVEILENAMIRLTSQGQTFATELMNQKELLSDEIAFFRLLRLQVTEKLVTSLTRSV